MANTDSKENGVYAWMTSVRASMDNDSSRKIFEDQVQSHAFIFLDNYLQDILAGPKQDPIIELVKTPGRKRNVPRRTRAATAAAATAKITTPLSLDDDTSSRNVIPVNSFHQALLQAKERSVRDALDMQKSTAELPPVSNGSPENTHGAFKSLQLVGIPEITASIEPESQAGVLPSQNYPRDPSSGTPFLAPEHGQLSVIAEGDESPDRSPAPILLLSTTPSDPDWLPQFHQVQEHLANEDNPIIIQVDHGSQGDPFPDVAYPVLSPVDAHPLDFPQEVQSPRSHTEPLPSRTTNYSPKNRERNAFTAPLPTIPVLNSIPVPQTISVPLNDASPKTLPHKSGAAGFPTLPAPSPLRKSMRVPQDVPASIVHPTIAPAPVPLGKRTSWLMKAREAKAMDGTSTLPFTSMAVTSAAVPRASTAVKRKSGEMLGAPPPGPDIDKDQRRPKVAKSTETLFVPPTSQEHEKTIRRDFLSAHDEPVALTSIAAAMPVHHLESHAMDVDKEITHMDSAEEGFIDLFKRTVEGLGARAARSTGKSLGGSVVAALAEARAAAEARVAERNKVNIDSSDSEAICDSGLPDGEPLEAQALQARTTSPEAEKTEGRLSLSDLVPVTAQHNKPEVSTKIAQSMEWDARIDSDNESVSTTPPDSPPSKGSSGFVKPAGPVFNKPPPQPVFMPASKQASVASKFPKEFTSNIRSGQFTLPAAVTLGIPAKLNKPSNGFPQPAQGESAQPPQSSIFSNPVFDKRDGIPTWVPSTQDNTDSQPCDPRPAPAVIDDDDDDDDSWPLEEKLAAAESGWRPFDFSNVDKEDTWSSLPTESQGPTRSLTTVILDEGDVEVDAKDEREPQAVEISNTERSIFDLGKPEELAEAEKASVNSEPVTRATSQTSMASTASSSQHQVGFFSQATKLVNNMLGGGKKAKPELKSLQLAAAVAKKQQEEADKKLQRLKDMEARRQVAIAKKAEEERTRLLEEEKKSREEFEKRKREREENTDRRPLKPPMSAKKADDDGSKKRKVALETEKKLESKKPPSRDKKDLVPQTKLAITPAIKAVVSKSTAAALVSSAAYNATQNPSSIKPVIPEAKPFKVVPSLKGKAKAKPPEDDIGDKLPSTMVQSQMAARVKAQMQTAKMVTPEVPSESIELPDINSEYSDSEDEDRVRTFDPPEWAHSPELRQALQMQSTVNPDDIFGQIQPLRMEELFRTRQSRFRARTSSANWSGTDRLTVEEIREYERRMGFQSTRAS